MNGVRAGGGNPACMKHWNSLSSFHKYNTSDFTASHSDGLMRTESEVLGRRTANAKFEKLWASTDMSQGLERPDDYK